MSDRTIVVGAGIVGLACAVELQRRGRQVTVIDRDGPSQGCSAGNAGMIATSENLPLVSPAHLRALPEMLLSAQGPAVIRLRSLPRLVPWLARAAATLTVERQAAISEALRVINGAALSAWRDLLDYVDARDLLVERGMIEIGASGSGTALEKRRASLHTLGVSTSLLGADDVRALEPEIDGAAAGGLLHPNVAHVRDPELVSQALLAAFIARGGRLARASVTAVEREDGFLLVRAQSGFFQAANVVVAAGLHAPKLLRPFGVVAPIQAERGYHLMLATDGRSLSRPLTFLRESFVATPMSGGLRLAGTVEFAAPEDAPDWRRADLLARHADRYFSRPLDRSGAQRWIGSRPSLPDSLPAIGRLSHEPRIFYAFGHQHLGLTQAAITASWLANLVYGSSWSSDLRPFDIARFGRHRT